MFATRHKACSIHVIEADSLLSDELDNEINIERVFEADSLSLHVYYMHVAKLVSFMFIAFDRTCSVHVYYIRVAKLVLIQ